MMYMYPWLNLTILLISFSESLESNLTCKLLILLCRYRVICFSLSQPTASTVANCSLILEKAGLENWAIGKTKVSIEL